MAAEELLQKGRRAVAAILKEQCNNKGPEVLNAQLNKFLNPEEPINDLEPIEWIEWLIAGGESPDDFKEKVKAFDTATTCGLVWTANFVAYRCRTCGISPCMSLCAECFQKGNHDGHDFNMFRSQAGGACDCGDTSVMRASGFCPKHGPRSKMSLPEVPPSLLNMARFIAPRLILRLIQHFRDSHQNPPPAPPDETQSAGAEANSSTTAAEYISMLQRLLEMGTAMHQVMTSALTSPEVYAELVVQPTAKAIHPDTPRSQRNSYHQRSHQLYMEAKKSLPPCQAPQKFQGLAPLDPNLEHKTFLDELMFWTVKLEFPQDLVCFLLTMLLDQTYKEEFMRTFVLHYGRISVMLSRSANAEPLSHRVVHVSVQLFSNEELAVRMVRDPELRLLHIMVVALKEMVTNILQPSTLHTEKLETNNLHLVADCSHRIMQTHCYWPLVSDLNNLLIHHQVAMDFLQPDYEDLIESWLAFVSMFQYMHLNQRELALHLEFEPKSYYAAFSAELEASATPMWSLISHLQGPEHLCVTRRLIKHCLTALEEWLESIDFAENDKPNRYQMSFHLPLHRNYAMFICQAVLNQGASLPNVLPPPETMKLIIMHPLHTLATFYEIMNALWVRNGVQIRGQSMTYIQCHFCNSMVDADIFLLQLSCGWVDSDWFLETFVDQFHLLEWFSMETEGPRFLEGDQVGPMLEGCLTLLALVCSLHNYLGLREEEVTAREMVAGLCMADRTHSQLLDILPEKCGTSLANQPPNFETVLQQVASYKAPNFEAGGNMLQGTYVPKPHVWEQLYDPIHVSLRAVHRKDQQASMDRFTHYVKQSGKVDCQGNLWPPYRVPGPLPNSQFRDPRIVLHTRTMHAMIFILLYRALNEQDISENTVSLTVHLLDMAVRHTVPRPGQTNKPQEEVPDLRFQEWYPTDNILENAFIPINSIALPTTSSSPDQAMEVDQAELTRLEVKESIVSLLLKLHSKYSGKPDSFRISRDDRECLMGDGAHFIGRLLNHLAVMCGEQSVLAVQQHIWPWRSPEEDLEDRKKLTENRRRLAKECQKKVLAEMKMQQRVFMQAMETEMGDLEEASASAKEYECVICGHPSPSTTERPIGMVVLIQATSTLGHARQQTPLPLPCSEQELASVDQRRTRAVAVEQAILKLQWNFEDTWQLGLNVGWRGGVHIQSCGHHLHMDCHRSYLDSLRNRISASQQQNSAVDWGEYSCPFCRQLANSVLPLAMEQPPPPTLDEELPVWKIYRLLSAAPQPVSDAFGNITSFMENVTNSTSAQSRHYIPEPTHTSLFLFISSLARVNLEIDLLQTSPKKSCFERLFQVFVLNAKLLIGYEPFKDLWSQLNLLEDEFSSRKVTKLPEMPLLLKDPTALLIHFSLILPSHFDQGMYQYVVRSLYRMAIIQGLVLTFEPYHLQEYLNSIKEDHWLWKPLNVLQPYLNSSFCVGESVENVETTLVDTWLLPFLKVASLLQAYLFDLPHPGSDVGDGKELVASLQLDSPTVWRGQPADAVVSSWLREYQPSLSLSSTLRHAWQRWATPRLLQLPHSYDTIFQFYHRRPCSNCNKAPQDSAVCLVCATLVCLREDCCRRVNRFEALTHALACGAGTAMFLLVNASTIIVIRGKRACLWGSVYLDSYGEEDRDLKRGKPLYLSEARYQLLEQQWLHHSFDHTNKRWVWHKDNL